MYLPSDNAASLVAWFRRGVGVTVTGAGVSSWADQSGNSRDLLQGSDTLRPAYDGSAIITFDGSDNFLKCGAFTLNQPTQISMLVSRLVNTQGKYFCDGNAVNSAAFWTTGSINQLALFAGGIGPLVAFPVGDFVAVAGVFNGASSSLQIGVAAPATGNAGAGNAGGFTLGADPDGGAECMNIAVKEVILRNVDDATIRAADQTYLIALQTDVTPVAAFSGTPLTGVPGLSVAFTDSSTNSPREWLWDFGDGQTATTQNPTNIYAADGTYTVTLTATNYGGADSEIKTDYITVTSEPSPSTGTTTSGVRKAKSGKFSVKLADLKSDQSTADFLKAQLRLKVPERAFDAQTDAEQRKARKEKRLREQREAKMRADAAMAERAKSDAQAEAMGAEITQMQKVSRQRKQLRTLMSLAAMVA